MLDTFYTGSSSELTEDGKCPAGASLLCNSGGENPEYTTGNMQPPSNSISICKRVSEGPDVFENDCLINAPGQLTSLIQQSNFDVCGCCEGYEMDPSYLAGDPSGCYYKTCCVPVGWASPTGAP